MGKGITIQSVCPGPVLTDALSTLLKDEAELAIAKAVIPNANDFTSQAVKTLGFSHQTTGFWKHALMYHFGALTTPGLSKILHKEVIRRQSARLK